MKNQICGMSQKDTERQIAQIIEHMKNLMKGLQS